MLHQRTCPGCGKVLSLRTEDLGGAAVCGACGRRFEAARGMDLVGGAGGTEPAARGRGAGQAHSHIVEKKDAAVAPKAPATPSAPAASPMAVGRSEDGVAAEVPPVQKTLARESPAKDAPARRAAAADSSHRTPSPWLIAAGGLLLLAIGLAAGWLVGRYWHGGGASDATAFAADAKRNADLLALKSEAEALAIQGKLEEAHERYRRLAALAAGREIRDPLLWDVMERAKVDQDRIYAILVNRAGPGESAWTPDRPTGAGSSPSTTTAPAAEAQLPVGNYPDGGVPLGASASGGAAAAVTAATARAVAPNGGGNPNTPIRCRRFDHGARQSASGRCAGQFGGTVGRFVCRFAPANAADVAPPLPRRAAEQWVRAGRSRGFG